MSRAVFRLEPYRTPLTAKAIITAARDIENRRGMPEDWRELWHPEEVVKMATLTAWHPCTADQVQP